MKKLILFLMLLLLCFTSLNAQIQVKKSSGTSTAAKTTLLLQPVSGEPTVPIYQLLDQSTMMASGSAGSATVTVSGSGQTIRLLCEAPAEIVLDGGTYQFQPCDSLLFNGRFQVSATGGTQVWEVKKGWGTFATPVMMSSIMSAILGPMLLIMGGTMDAPPGIMVMGGAFSLWAVIGLPLGLQNRPSAKLIETY